MAVTQRLDHPTTRYFLGGDTFLSINAAGAAQGDI
jgi:hypothetical protein